jgi:hypothetical protein
MAVTENSDAQTAAQMQVELVRFADKCHYDEARKKIVYHSARYAMEAYMVLQREEMERHKWIESEKHCCDLGRQALAEWVSQYSEKFSRYWRRTHVYIPLDGPPQNSQS